MFREKVGGEGEAFFQFGCFRSYGEHVKKKVKMPLRTKEIQCERKMVKGTLT